MKSFFSRPFFAAAFLWLVLLVAGFFLLDRLLMPYVAGRFKETAEVPALSNLTPQEAEKALEDRGLRLMLDSTAEYSPTVGAGRILQQSPEPGTEVKEGRRIWVKVSKGLQAVEIPEVRGLSLRQAEITLQQAGLALGPVMRVRHPTIPPGAVIGSIPPSRTQAHKGDAVKIQLSEGGEAEDAAMPDLLGLSLSQAEARLKAAGFSLGEVTEKKEKKKLPKTVLRQSIPPGKKGGSAGEKTVDLEISK